MTPWKPKGKMPFNHMIHQSLVEWFNEYADKRGRAYNKQLEIFLNYCRAHSKEIESAIETGTSSQKDD